MQRIKTILGVPFYMVSAGLILMLTQFSLGKTIPTKSLPPGPFQKFPIQAVISNGHNEFAWTIIGIQGLAQTVNVWSILHTPNVDQRIREVQLGKFDDSLANLPDLASQALGMRELFLFPASVLAFEMNDIDRAVEVARMGAKDIRLEADLALSIAYLTHIFKGDLQQAAKDYERVQLHYPNVSWLKETIASLKMGIDPFKRQGRSRSKICFMMSRAFPLSKQRLIERGVCNQDQLQEGTEQ
jgi:hypothetical protein